MKKTTRNLIGIAALAGLMGYVANNPVAKSGDSLDDFSSEISANESYSLEVRVNGKFADIGPVINKESDGSYKVNSYGERIKSVNTNYTHGVLVRIIPEENKGQTHSYLIEGSERDISNLVRKLSSKKKLGLDLSLDAPTEDFGNLHYLTFLLDDPKEEEKTFNVVYSGTVDIRKADIEVN